jgi:hypothetical protein
MTTVAELSVDQGIELALEILLTHGWESKYYPSWQEYAQENYDETEENTQGYSLQERQGAWEALMEYTKNQATDGKMIARYVANQSDGLAHASEVYFVVLSLSDDTGTRYFKRDGYYSSYNGGTLEEGENSEVFPNPVTVTDFKESK